MSEAGERKRDDASLHPFVESLDGSYSSVVGLPPLETARLFAAAGIVLD